jgi:hypothetical protein
VLLGPASFTTTSALLLLLLAWLRFAGVDFGFVLSCMALMSSKLTVLSLLPSMLPARLASATSRLNSLPGQQQKHLMTSHAARQHDVATVSQQCRLSCLCNRKVHAPLTTRLTGMVDNRPIGACKQHPMRVALPKDCCSMLVA